MYLLFCNIEELLIKYINVMKNLKDFSKDLNSVEVKELLGNKMKNVKGGRKSAPLLCWTCTTCNPGKSVAS